MKVRSSHLVVAIIAVVGVIVVLALVKPSGEGPGKKTLSTTDEFLSQVNEIRESGRGSTITDGLVPSTEVDLSQHKPLEFSEQPVSMGTIARDRKAEKRITVKNPGGLPIDVMDITTSCNCTLGHFERAAVRSDGRRITTIEAGQQETLVVTVDPKLIHGFHSSKVLTIMTNDPVQANYTLVVSADVDPEFSQDPEFIDFGTVQRGKGAEARMRIVQLTDDPFDITAAQLEPSSSGSGPDAPAKESPIELELVKLPEAEWKSPQRAEWELVVRLLPTAAPGAIDVSAWLVTTAARVRDFGIAIVGSVSTFYEVVPASLGARDVVTPGQKQVAKATVTGIVPITLADATVTGEGLTLEVAPRPDDPKSVDLYINVAPDAAPGLKSETVMFTVTGDNQSVPHAMRAFVSVQGQAPAPPAQ